MAINVNRIARVFGIQVIRDRKSGKYERVVSIKPEGAPRGSVLLAYVLDPFLLRKDAAISDDHTHDWESYQIAHTFLREGFAVDVISYLNCTFLPEKKYDYFVGARTNFDRLSARLDPSCVKVVHLDTAHWLFNNQAAYTRLLSVQRRRCVTLHNHKMIENNWAIENADVATVLGNEFTMGTYEYAGKPMYRIPISVPCTYSWDDSKDFAQCRTHYLWFGSSGFVHKGLDLVLEAFKGMPDYRLTRMWPFAFREKIHKCLSRRAL